MVNEETLKKPLATAEAIVVGAIGLTLLLGIRAAGLWWGLPNSAHYFSYHPDEIFLLLPSFGFAQGDWNPHFFNYGTLYIYLVGIPAVILRLLPDPSQFPAGLAPLYLLGRIITAILGATSVLVLYLAVRSEHRSGARTSALLLALCPLHVVSSWYATVDVPATFFLTLAFLLAIRGSRRPTARIGTLSGVAVGLAAATKYNTGLFVIPVLLAPLLAKPKKWSWSWFLGTVAGAIAAFVTACPFFWTDEFRRDLLFELRHAEVGGTLAFVGTGSGWSYHLLHGLPAGLGYAMLAAVLLGVIAAIRSRSVVKRLSLLWVVLYLVAIGVSKERFIRYLVPLTPFLCVLAAAGLVWAEDLPRRAIARGAAASLTVIVFSMTFLYTMGQAADLLNPDPRDSAGFYAPPLGRLPRGHTVGLVHAPWFYHPTVSPFNAGPFSQHLFDKWNRETEETVVVTGWDAGELKAHRPDCFFLSDLESRDLLRLGNPEVKGFVAALESLYRDRDEFARELPLPWNPSWLAPPRSWAPPDWLYQSPVITMYYNPL